MEILKTKLTNHVTKLDIGMEIADDKATISGTVELDIENQSQFVEVVNGVFEDGKDGTNVVVDLSNITYIDSSGLWALFEGHKKALQHNGKMVLLSPTKDVRRVLDITKMSGKLEIYDSESDALSHLTIV